MRCYTRLSSSFSLNIRRKSKHLVIRDTGFGKPWIAENSKGANLHAKMSFIAFNIPNQWSR
jgi:hypothetical protein